MVYLLDICVISDFVKGEPNTLERLKSIPPSDVAISTITHMEIQYGLANIPTRATKIRPILDGICQSVQLLTFGEPEAIAAAQIRHHLKTTGQPIGAYDVLIAATAIANDLITVTSNIKEFERIPGIKIENWRHRKKG